MCSSLRKKIDKVTCGDITINEFKVDFGEGDPSRTKTVPVFYKDLAPYKDWK